MLDYSNFSSKHFLFQATIDQPKFIFCQNSKEGPDTSFVVFPESNTFGFFMKTYFHQPIKFLCLLTTQRYKNVSDNFQILTMSRTAA